MSKDGDNDNQLTGEKSEKDYGSDYKNHVIELYKFYAGTADAVSTRRQSANNFFLTLNTALIAVIGYSFRYSSVNNAFVWMQIPIIVLGLALCYQWYRTIKSHKQLNDGKFGVILSIEKKLPFAPYDSEWKALGEGKDPQKYEQTTHIEMNIPWLFVVLYLMLFCIIIYQQCANC